MENTEVADWKIALQITLLLLRRRQRCLKLVKAAAAIGATKADDDRYSSHTYIEQYKFRGNFINVLAGFFSFQKVVLCQV